MDYKMFLFLIVSLRALQTNKTSVHSADMEENIQRQVSHILNKMYVVQRGK